MTTTAELDEETETEAETGTEASPAPADARRGARPAQLAPFFALTAILHGLALASRFSEVAVRLPAGLAEAILFAQLPLLLVEGLLEGGLDYGRQTSGLPGWMRIRSLPVKVSFTLAFSYLAVVVLQTWQLSIGPIDPSPPASWPLEQRAFWFGVMTVGMFFVNYLATASLLIPVLRFLTAPFRRLPRALALPLVAILGTGLGYGVVLLLGSDTLGSRIASLRSAIEARPGLAIGISLGLVLVPVLFELLRGEKQER